MIVKLVGPVLAFVAAVVVVSSVVAVGLFAQVDTDRIPPTVDCHFEIYMDLNHPMLLNQCTGESWVADDGEEWDGNDHVQVREPGWYPMPVFKASK